MLNTLLMQNVTVPTYDGKFNLSYQDLCLSYDWVCGNNEHIELFRQVSKVGRVISLSYPKGGSKVSNWFEFHTTFNSRTRRLIWGPQLATSNSTNRTTPFWKQKSRNFFIFWSKSRNQWGNILRILNTRLNASFCTTSGPTLLASVLHIISHWKMA